MIPYWPERDTRHVHVVLLPNIIIVDIEHFVVRLKGRTASLSR
jgi:hypothetical protein